MPGATAVVASLVRSEAAGPTTCASVLRAIPIFREGGVQ